MIHKQFLANAGVLIALSLAGQGPAFAQIKQTTLDPVVQNSIDSPSSEAITSTPLSASQPDAVGILTSQQTGIPQNFWGNGDPKVIARLIAPYFDFTLHEITALWQRIALSEIDPPARVSNPGTLLSARVAHLLNAGALDQAEALLNQAGPSTPELFQQSFEVGLLTGRAQSACATMLRNPSLAPGLKERVFCLARENDWSAAALTLTTAKSLRQIPELDAELLTLFLDPELFDESNPPPAPVPLTALDFIMREALAMPRSGQALPLAFLHQDLQRETGWRNQVIAMERLVRSQAIPPQQLIALYQDGKPSASGGVWVRVSAVQKLLRAMDVGTAEQISDALRTAYRDLNAVGLEFILSDIAADDLEGVALTPSGDRTRFFLNLLHADNAELVADYAPQTATDAFLQTLALGELPETASTDIEAAILAAFQGTTFSNSLIEDAKRGQMGEAIMKSMINLIRSRHRDPAALETTIATLRIAGLEDEARRIAIQAVLYLSRRS
ncbi:hypothetical protein [Amylibacter sp. IMCC11727]|uniref:hypothetical protein n=1 Tax=Amylibacter sp. IMCC11727 TaxID=3039851 RepID=UPI00244E5285|nr:hypothetical protein [Amylibacter sp. IMCC11727]WGI20315.1 hypothetical protein QBD29_09285 [Amylibacter sp. IMCC11727]